ncbi:hypothetical protein Bcav_2941 [Beutenbergia cavernae DSM 12333]|uniref:Uncharacterized protein n=1 Tax=Beutenbergia cavernae (strain ATCC BAA-8 / DSM 12333 / CCUG 43141 / JCM 11478 / NBRC 16432 / NCIMB 13614 / HKI 0122) TaxID=471853 RepID=C5BZ71_BEUC1|nr:hypothetical protein [Beutenbergia cavernae]ACQ81186.1 hypothetical protein Bcav_2941 [Beutenbergia cavernae DSM 12333]
MNELRLNVSRVKAADETGTWPEWGSDDIYLAAVTVDSRLVVNTVDEVRIGEFDDGDARDFSPAKTLARFRLDDGVYPRAYVAAVVLAERDNGEAIPEFLTALTKSVKENLPTERDRRRRRQGPAADDAASGFEFLGFTGKELATIAWKGVQEAWKVYKKIRADDIFLPKTLYVDIDGEDHRWDGSRRSPLEKLRLAAHDGVYWVGMHWAIADGSPVATPPSGRPTRVPREPRPTVPARHEN